MQFSVLMSVYKKEIPIFLKQALESVYDQTLQPSEIVLIEDGLLTNELYEIIEEFSKKCPVIRVIKLSKNRGLGEALRVGVEECKYEYIFRADTDDICVKDRFEKQLKFMLENKEVDVLGTDIAEFKDNIQENMRIKKMPTNNEINMYITKRNPLNHMTVCMKKEAVLKAGNYQPLQYLEDYYLWIRMFNLNMKIQNINETLVYARIGNGFEKRRGNKKQIEGWNFLQEFMYKNGIINKKRCWLNKINMYAVVYMPTFSRKILYKLLRKG